MRSEHTKLTDQGAAIVAITAQDPDDSAAYQRRESLPFTLLSDGDRKVMQAYDVFNAISLDAFRIAHPSAFVIDPDGVIRYSFVASNQLDWPQTSLLAEELARAKRERGEA